MNAMDVHEEPPESATDHELPTVMASRREAPQSVAEWRTQPAASSLPARPGEIHAWGDVRYAGLFGGLLGICLLSGCSDFTMTNPPRTVTEQLVLSTAADRALRAANLEMFEGKRVFIDGTYFDSFDAKYVLGAIRDTFSQAGALLAVDAGHSDYIVEARSGGYSVDYNSSLIGIPTMGVPIPLAGALNLPELAFFKSSKQNSIAKFALLAYDTKTREHYYSSGPLVGKAFNNYDKCFGFLWVGTDIPEKQQRHD